MTIDRTTRSDEAGPRNDRVSSRDRVLFGLTRERVAVSSLPEDKRRSIDYTARSYARDLISVTNASDNNLPRLGRRDVLVDSAGEPASRPRADLSPDR
jgi:hypothetical protein